MHLNDIQKRVDKWIKQFEVGYWPPLSMFAALVEEVGELGREINSLEGHKPKKIADPETPKNILGLELADTLFSLVCIANHYDVNLESFLDRIFEKYSSRDGNRWTRKDFS
ncbi:MAG: nucleotide pyrophosphohydrolase [Candidatus Helarchaeota archaeon]